MKITKPRQPGFCDFKKRIHDSLVKYYNMSQISPKLAMNMKAFYGDLQLGILGGGQLGRMLIQEAINFNVTTRVLDPDPDAPCKHLCDQFKVG